MNKKRNKLREAKDLKYGYGGKKRNIKRNDKKSTNAFGKDTRRQGSTSSGFKVGINVMKLERLIRSLSNIIISPFKVVFMKCSM